VERTSFDKLRIQRNANFDPGKVAKFVHELKSQVELANLRGLYDGTKEMAPEMRWKVGVLSGFASGHPRIREAREQRYAS
jgi:hypothetical protein